MCVCVCVLTQMNLESSSREARRRSRDLSWKPSKPGSDPSRRGIIPPLLPRLKAAVTVQGAASGMKAADPHSRSRPPSCHLGVETESDEFTQFLTGRWDYPSAHLDPVRAEPRPPTAGPSGPAHPQQGHQAPPSTPAQTRTSSGSSSPSRSRTKHRLSPSVISSNKLV